jgi:ERCC4-type nuclease
MGANHYAKGMFMLTFLIFIMKLDMVVAVKKCPGRENIILNVLCGEKISINCQKEEILDALRLFVNESQARKIYEYIKYTKIDSIDDLEKIKGVGPKTIQRISEFFSTEKDCK